jgi:DNA-directed RNA polymerase subunit RPC12/RpoP
MSNELTSTQNVEEIRSYAVTTVHDAQSDLSNDSSSTDIKRSSSAMLVKCRACGEEFDSPLAVDDFPKLLLDQKESGTLQMCPHCGTLGLYAIRDYCERRRHSISKSV